MTQPAPNEWRIEDGSIGQSYEVSYSVDDADMHAFAELSGDHNPLHLEDTFARKSGFEGCVVYGGIHTAKVSQIVGMHCPGRNGVLTRVDLSFHNPLYVGQTAKLTGVVKDVVESVRIVRLDLRIECEGKLIAKGLVEARVNA